MIPLLRQILRTGIVTEPPPVADSLQSATTRRLAEEVRMLADAARRVCPPERRLQSRIRGIQGEMERLTSMAATPEFRRLAPEKRQLLRKGLVQSREQLLRVMGQVPAPTKLLQ